MQNICSKTYVFLKEKIWFLKKTGSLLYENIGKNFFLFFRRNTPFLVAAIKAPPPVYGPVRYKKVFFYAFPQAEVKLLLKRNGIICSYNKPGNREKSSD